MTSKSQCQRREKSRPEHTRPRLITLPCGDRKGLADYGPRALMSDLGDRSDISLRRTFTEVAQALKPDRFATTLTEAFHDAGFEPVWRVLHIGPFRRGQPTRLEVIGPSPLGPWSRELSLGVGQFTKRWHGYRHLAIGVVIPPDDRLPPGTPYLRLSDRQDGDCIEQLVLLVQWAAAEGCATVARATFSPSESPERRLRFDTRTVGRPMTPREAQLAQRAQVLLRARTPRGRPLEMPIDALERLIEARSLLGKYDALDRANLTRRTTLSSLEGLDKLRQRALLDRIADLPNLVQTDALEGS
jgi:hypothetical protein